MTEDFLFNEGYKKTKNNTYEKIDEETGMTIELEFSNGDSSINEKIENNIIDILTRQDI